MLILILYGSGANGKTTLLNALIATLGSHNVSKESLGNIAYGKWYAGNLFGKLANIYGEIGLHELKNTGVIKILTGDDWATGERKYQNPFSFQNNAKPAFSANILPVVYDKSDAFYRRFHIIPLTQQFLKGSPETDPEMIKKLTTPEGLSAILNWGLEGRARLRKQKKFSELPAIDKRRELWEAYSNPLKDFIEECVVKCTDAYVTKDAFYNAYRQHAIENKKTLMTKEKLGRILKHIIPVDDFHATIGGERRYAWRGIYLKDEGKKKIPEKPTKFDDYIDKIAEERKNKNNQHGV